MIRHGQGCKYGKLNPREAKLHQKEYKKVQAQLKEEWSHETGQAWPTTKKVDLKTGEADVIKHQAHHIIPQQIGGPHKWWNIHPVEQVQHQGGVHGAKAPLRKIMKDKK